MSAVHLAVDGAVAELRLYNPQKLNALLPSLVDRSLRRQLAAVRRHAAPSTSELAAASQPLTIHR